MNPVLRSPMTNFKKVRFLGDLIPVILIGNSLLDLVFASSPSSITEPVECPLLFDTAHTVLSFNFNVISKVRRQILRTV